MKRKKLLSTAVAGLLVAAQMVMPVMATDGGQVDVAIDTTNVVIRVKVPTSLAVSVNQFEKGDQGSQITSDSFTIENMSEIPVWVTVDSKLTKAAFDLKGKRNDAKTSTVAAGEAWIGVVAQAKASSGAGGTIVSADYAKTGDTFAALNEDSENVDTFVDDSGKTSATAKQEFYLAKPASGSTVTYRSFIPKEDAKADVAYARFYELTKIEAPSDGSKTLQEMLDDAIKAGDVYKMAEADKDKTDEAVDIITKGTPISEDDTNEEYYKLVDTDPVAEASLDSGKFYVYATDVAGGKTSFRYIGSLSDSKTTPWSSGASGDFIKMEIKYDIKGLTDTKYQAAVTDNSLLNGYKKNAAAPSIATTTYNYDRTTTLDIPINLGSGNLAATAVTKVEAAAAADGAKSDFTSNVTIATDKITLSANNFAGASVGDTRCLFVTFNDGTTTHTTVMVTLTITN